MVDKTKKAGKKTPAKTDKTIIKQTTIEKKMAYSIRSAMITGIEPEKGVATGVGAVTSKKDFDKDTLYRESRPYMRTTAKNVGRGQLNLFTMQEYIDYDLERESYSRIAGGIGQILIREWQRKPQDDDGFITIKNLTPIAKEMNTTPQRLKEYLVMLGGFTYPTVKLVKGAKKGKQRIELFHSKLFDIRFICDVDEDGNIPLERRVGTSHSYFISDVAVVEIKIKPNEEFINSLEGRGLGYVLASEETAQLARLLSDMGYKLFNFTAANKPAYKVGWEKLIKNLGISEEELAKRGKPYYQKIIEKAFEQLEELGHIEKWQYSSKRDMYSWKYTNKYIGHPENPRKDPNIYGEDKGGKNDG